MKKKTEELSEANLENVTFANLFSSRVFKYYTNVAFTSFALNLLLSIYIIFLQHICSEQIYNYLCKYIFSFSVKTAIIARSNNSHNLWITFITLFKYVGFHTKMSLAIPRLLVFLAFSNWL